MKKLEVEFKREGSVINYRVTNQNDGLISRGYFRYNAGEYAVRSKENHEIKTKAASLT